MDDEQMGDINVETCDINDLWKFDIDRLESIYLMLEMEKKLCVCTGEDVIAEFGFKGNYEEVLTQLNAFIENVKATPYIESDRAVVLERLDRYNNYMLTKYDPYHDEILMNIKKRTLEGLHEAVGIADHKRAFTDLLHEKKECLCYIN